MSPDNEENEAQARLQEEELARVKAELEDGLVDGLMGMASIGQMISEGIEKAIPQDMLQDMIESKKKADERISKWLVGFGVGLMYLAVHEPGIVKDIDTDTKIITAIVSGLGLLIYGVHTVFFHEIMSGTMTILNVLKLIALKESSREGEDRKRLKKHDVIGVDDPAGGLDKVLEELKAIKSERYDSLQEEMESHKATFEDLNGKLKYANRLKNINITRVVGFMEIASAIILASGAYRTLT